MPAAQRATEEHKPRGRTQVGHHGQVVYKAEGTLWDMVKSGQKMFEFRRYDLDDERIQALRSGDLNEKGVFNSQVKEVVLVNKLTLERLTMGIKEVRFASWAPGWVIFIFTQAKMDLGGDAKPTATEDPGYIEIARQKMLGPGKRFEPGDGSRGPVADDGDGSETNEHPAGGKKRGRPKKR